MQVNSRAISIGFALVTLIIHLAVGRYGYFRDELYFLVCGFQLDWGYVDQPPMIALIARLTAELFGVSLLSIKIFPALAHGLLAALMGVMASQIVNDRFSTVLACLAGLFTPFFMATGHLLTMNIFEPLFWLMLVYLVMKITEKPDRRYWIIAGIILACGFLTKYTMVFFSASLILGLSLTKQRKLLANKYLFLTIGLAGILVLPNVLWQLQQGLPFLELLENGRRVKNAEFSLAKFLLEQPLQINFSLFAIAIAGLVAPFTLNKLTSYRWISISFAILLVLYIFLKAKAYYLAPAYPMILILGSCCMALIIKTIRIRIIFLSLLIPSLFPPLPIVLPILAPQQLAEYMQALGMVPQSDEKKQLAGIPQVFADQFGWPELVASVAKAVDQLNEEERQGAVILARNYGQAGAIDILGKNLDLPPVISGHNNYFLWGPQSADGKEIIIIGGTLKDHQDDFESVVPVASTDHPFAMPYERKQTIFIGRNLKRAVSEGFLEIKNYQ